MSGGRRDRKKKSDGDAAVEELLREAEDDLLLKLTVNAHTTSSSSVLNPDLARRFEALKSPPPPSHQGRSPPPRSSSSIEPAPVSGGRGGPVEEEWRSVLGDDLAARFAALKDSSADSSSGPRTTGPVLESDDGEDGDVSRTEVEKVVQWAMDAARLDPSKTDDDDDGVDDDDDLEEVRGTGKEEGIKMKEKGKPKKWFFF